ncbi:hypothetical protein L6164_009672 [Bauhinia variegata]|uniref:Uncharacterized protein n=1 Tax=Bauhinia variegata TaxID=167791 RepID=A0ACB9PKN8_BAUVA|nr:hypothetical protein L6164_009672 [Bauhinia variegata]
MLGFIPWLFGHSVTEFQFKALVVLFLQTICVSSSSNEGLLRGFSAVPDSSVTSFQAFLSDHTGNFSLGFLRVDRTQLALAVLHVPSSQPFWLANPTRLARWSDSTRLSFNGSLVISDPHEGVLWSTGTTGDSVLLLNTSNLQVQSDGDPPSVLWQSFDFPTDSLVENQNFTSSMSLVSSNGLYSLRLGDDFMGLYANFLHSDSDSEQVIYWKHKALEVKAQIVEGGGPLYALVNTDGYLGMYQYQTSSKPMDVQKFDSFQRSNISFLMVRIEPDGNLNGYYWDGSKWALNYQAIAETCELLSPCGSYGLCKPGGSGSGCSCLDNRTSYQSGTGCFDERQQGYGDFCGQAVAENNYWVLRRKGVEAPDKEFLSYETLSSVEQCESLCEKNCSCWGALYNNANGFCYSVDYPIQTMSGTGDESKVGFFKVRNSPPGKKKRSIGVVVGVVVGSVVLIAIIGIGLAIAGYLRWKTKGAIRQDGISLSPGPYKNLGSSSFSYAESK